MADRGLKGRHILVVEDEFILADELAMELADRGATVLGPAPGVEAALALVESGETMDGAVLDVNLGGRPVYPVADRLIDRGIPIVFITGYDVTALPDRFRNIERCDKPIDIDRVIGAIGRALAG